MLQIRTAVNVTSSQGPNPNLALTLALALALSPTKSPYTLIPGHLPQGKRGA